MPQPAHYQQVIQRVLERASSQNLSPNELSEKICDGLDLAEAIMGDGPGVTNIKLPRPTPSPGMIIAATPAYREPDLSQGMLVGDSSRPGRGPGRYLSPEETAKAMNLSSSSSGQVRSADDPYQKIGILRESVILEEAPPSAITRNADMPASQETPEEIETKKAALHSHILRTLPASLVLEIPGLGFPVKLERFVKPSPSGMNFIRVSYSQHQSEEDGPQIQFSTADAILPSAEAVKAEILAQAGAKYRAKKATIIARVPQSAGMPDIDKMQFHRNSANGTDDNVPQEDIADWNRLSKTPSRI